MYNNRPFTLRQSYTKKNITFGNSIRIIEQALSQHSFTGIDLTDQAIFNGIFDRYQPGLLGVATRMLGSREDAEDVITEVFLRLWQSQGAFENVLAVGGWLRVTVRNQCLNLLKQRNVTQGRLNELAVAMNNIEDDWYHEDLLGELLQEVYQAVQTLPEKSREVFRLRYIEGLKNEDIARQLGIRHQSVRNHLSTALKHLRLLFMDRPDLLCLLALLYAMSDDSRLF